MSQKQETYIAKYWDAARKAAEKYKINPVVILAQGAFESDWGTSVNARDAKNLFGVTAAGSTNEYWNGSYRKATTGLKFRKYSTEGDSIMDFARLISAKYKDAAKVSDNYAAYAKAISYSPYISEQNGDNRENYRSAVLQFSNKIEEFLKKKDFLKPLQ